MMCILQVRDINQVAEQYASARGHSAAVYEPSLAGGFAPLPIKLAMIPGRLFSLRRVVGRLDQAHFDLAHIHWASYGVLGLASRIPFVLQCHGSDVRARLETPFFRALLAPVFRRAGAVLCIIPDLLDVTRSLRGSKRSIARSYRLCSTRRAATTDSLALSRVSLPRPSNSMLASIARSTHESVQKSYCRPPIAYKYTCFI
ncbi:MAG TPA: glycosyltransferase [Ktedonobacterales bacterium]|nr:glycosyltransferase [Ktedonobacterales bacterium]